MSQYRNVTMIDDLPDLDAPGNGIGVGEPVNQLHSQYEEQRGGLTPDQYKKYIREKKQMYDGSGMESYNRQDPYGRVEAYQPPQEMMVPPPPQPAPRFANIQHSCLDVAGHVQDCPICSKFYNQDRTIYIIVIVILSLICLLLLKKILGL